MNLDKYMEKKLASIHNNSGKCKCGHTVLFNKIDKVYCTWCGNYCYRTPQIEFREKMKGKIKNVQN